MKMTREKRGITREKEDEDDEGKSVRGDNKKRASETNDKEEGHLLTFSKKSL